MMPRDPDQYVDRLVSGEPFPSDSAGGVDDPARAGDLLLVHGMLGRFAEGESERSARSLTRALERIADDQRPIRFAWRRLVPLGIAALVMVGVFGLWWNVSSQQRALADLRDGHVRHGMRRYAVEILRAADAAPRVTGSIDVDGAGRMVARIALPPGGPQPELLFGRTADGWWIAEANGSIGHSPDKSVVVAWIRAVAGDAPIPSVDETLARLATDYTVNWTIDEQDPTSVIFNGTRRSADRTEAELVQIRYARSTSRIREILWEWRPPVGSIAQVRQVRATLEERMRPGEEAFLPASLSPADPEAPAASR